MCILVAVSVLAVMSTRGSVVCSAAADIAESSDAETLNGTALCVTARTQLNEAWRTLLAADTGNVTLLGFQGTILEYHPSSVSVRKRVSPLHLHRGAVVKYASADSFVNIVSNAGNVAGRIEMGAAIEGVLADTEGPHLLTARLEGMYFDVEWNETAKIYVVCLDRAGYVTELRSDENYVRWGQDVEALLAGAAVTALVTQLYGVANTMPDWTYCEHKTTHPHPLAPYYT